MTHLAMTTISPPISVGPASAEVRIPSIYATDSAQINAPLFRSSGAGQVSSQRICHQTLTLLMPSDWTQVASYFRFSSSGTAARCRLAKGLACAAVPQTAYLTRNVVCMASRVSTILLVLAGVQFTQHMLQQIEANSDASATRPSPCLGPRS